MKLYRKIHISVIVILGLFEFRPNYFPTVLDIFSCGFFGINNQINSMISIICISVQMVKHYVRFPPYLYFIYFN